MPLPVPQRVPRQETPLLRVVEAMCTQHQPRVDVRVAARLRPEAPRVRLHRNRTRAPPEGVRALYLPIAIAPLRHVPTVVEGVKDGGVGGDRAPQEQARRTERVDGKEAVRPVVLAHRIGAIIEEVGASAPRLLPRLKVVPVIAVCLDHTIGHQTVFRVEGKHLTSKALSF